MLIDKSQKRWGLLTGVLFIASGALYWLYAHQAVGGPRGGSWQGLAFGVAGSSLMAFAGLIAARKRVRHWPIGSAQFWLRGHLWLGTLSVPLILFHAGFGWGGLLEQMLLVVMGGVVVSGFFGLVLQQVLPRQITTRVPLETFYAQIPHICDVLQVEGDVAVAAVCGPLPMTPARDVATIALLDALEVKQAPTTGKKADGKEKGKEKTAEEKEREKHDKLLASVYLPALDNDQEPKPLESAKVGPPALPGTEGPVMDGNGPEGALAGKREKVQVVKELKSSATGPANLVTPVESMNPERATMVAPSAPAAAPPPGKVLTAAEKIAPSAAETVTLLRAAKKTVKPADVPGTEQQATSLNSAEPAAVAMASAPPTKTLTAAEKIALMRAKKQPVKAEEMPPAAVEPAHVDPAGASDVPQRGQAEADGMNSVRQAPATSAEAPPTKTLTAAEKIALMRAKKQPVKTEDTLPAVVEPPHVDPAGAAEASQAGQAAADAAEAPPAKTLSAADKIALMRAKKQTAKTEPPASDTVESTSPVVSPQANQAAADGMNSVLPTAPTAKTLSAADKIALMKSKKAGASSTPAPAAAAKPAAPVVKAVPAPRMPVADDAWKDLCPMLQQFYFDHVRRFMGRDMVRSDLLADDAAARLRFAFERARLPSELHEALDQLADLCDERRQLATQARIHGWLHGWLYLHVPLSMALLGLGVVHAVMSLYY